MENPAGKWYNDIVGQSLGCPFSFGGAVQAPCPRLPAAETKNTRSNRPGGKLIGNGWTGKCAAEKILKMN